MVESTESPRPEAPPEEASQSSEARQSEDAPQAPTDASSADRRDEPQSTSDATPEPPQPAVGAGGSERDSSQDDAKQNAAAPDAATDAEASNAGGQAASGEGSEGEPSKAKKKRRKRKKKKAAAAAEGKPASSHAALARFFAGAAKKHAFAVGEVIAGRVVKADQGAIVVDLFGKAKAIADIREPREIAVDEPVEQAAPEGAAADEAAAAAGSEVAGEPRVDPSAEATTPPAQAEEPVGTEQQPPELQASHSPEAAVERDKPRSVEEQAPEASAEQAPEASAEQAPEASAEQIEARAAAESQAAETSSHQDDTAPQAETAAAEGEPEPPAPEPPSPGEIFRGRVGVVAESGHIGIVNRRVDRGAVRARLDEAREQHRRVEGVVFGYNRGGFDVLIDGARAFCPASGMALEDIEDPEAYVGHKLEFSLPPSKAGSKDIIVSRRSILEKEQRKRAKALLRSLESGEVRKGKVTQIRDFGVFVDLGGIEGLVHQSELSYDRSVRPADVAKVGDEVEVKVLKVGGDGSSKKDRQRVSLSLKALQPDPWDEHKEALREGSIRKGVVRRTTDFGAFVELAPNIEGLVHITELGRSLKHADQALNEGDEILVSIDRVDRKARKISLSKLTDEEAKAFEEGKLDAEPKPQSLRPGATVTVRIERLEPRGMQVRVLGAVGKRARGFLPNSELGSEDSGKGRKSLTEGSELDVKIVGSDRDHRLKLSRKAHLIDEERRAVKEYRKEASKKGLGTFGDLLKSKLGEITPKQ